MDAITKIADERIRDAIEKGEFDHLPGKGKALDLRDYFNAPPTMRMALHLLKNAGFLPQEIVLLRELDELE